MREHHCRLCLEPQRFFLVHISAVPMTMILILTLTIDYTMKKSAGPSVASLTLKIGQILDKPAPYLLYLGCHSKSRRASSKIRTASTVSSVVGEPREVERLF